MILPDCKSPSSYHQPFLHSHMASVLEKHMTSTSYLLIAYVIFMNLFHSSFQPYHMAQTSMTHTFCLFSYCWGLLPISLLFYSLLAAQFWAHFPPRLR